MQSVMMPNWRDRCIAAASSVASATSDRVPKCVKHAPRVIDKASEVLIGITRVHMERLQLAGERRHWYMRRGQSLLVRRLVSPKVDLKSAVIFVEKIKRVKAGVFLVFAGTAKGLHRVRGSKEVNTARSRGQT